MIDKFGLHIRNGKFIGKGFKTSRSIQHGTSTVERELNRHSDEIAKKSGIEYKKVQYTVNAVGLQAVPLDSYFTGADIVYCVGVRKNQSNTICFPESEDNYLRFTAPETGNYNLSLIGVYN